ncbi:MAG: isoaspartyl peptidase/L-asparaginase [Myxococcales bacterium]|nr:isoaspartyl peptidase/L-asparaginase [Myxococcales bacterium]
MFGVVVHGGAGAVARADTDDATAEARRAGLRAALAAAHAILAAGGPALDAVEAAVVVLEDDPGFNAGRGAVFTHAGTIELDAALMDGATGAAGAVAAVTTARNPIRAARAVMERTPHVLLAGPGADAFVRAAGLEVAPPDYFATAERRAQLERARARGAVVLDHGGDTPNLGTVGAVALDAAGRLAAATSTGGMTNKRYGRVGDSPILGAGTWADGRVAVSCTGHGEAFLRTAAAHAVAARMRWGGAVLEDAAREALADVRAAGGSGGLIGIDAAGRTVMPFDTGGMYRGQWLAGDAGARVAIWGEGVG